MIFPTPEVNNYIRTLGFSGQMNEAQMSFLVDRGVPKTNLMEMWNTYLTDEQFEGTLPEKGDDFSSSFLEGKGFNVVRNGNFTDNLDSWSDSGGVLYDDGKADYAGVLLNKGLFQDCLRPGKNYEIKFTISGYVLGSFRFIAGTGSAGITRSGDGTFTETVTAGADGLLRLYGVSAFTGKINNITAKEIL